jgi:hypothetical protein
MPKKPTPVMPKTASPPQGEIVAVDESQQETSTR